MKVLVLILVLAVGYTTVNADNCAHTWNTVTTNDGRWNMTLRPLYEISKFFTPDCKPLNTDSWISSNKNVTYGFMYGKNATFDNVYALTLVNSAGSSIVSKACIFLITAIGPDDPDIKVVNYNGANCKVTLDGHYYIYIAA